MERLRPELESTLRAAGATPPAAALEVLVDVWSATLGDGVARSAWPARLAADGTLHVATASSAWAQELTLMGGEILAALQASVPAHAPTRLRFAPGPLPEFAPLARPRPPLPVPTEEEEETATALASVVGDEELREAIRRAARASLAARRMADLV